ncbi:CRISPR-associated helicase Cas3' [Terrimonas sp.]|uniref:CRISPR-associated helicase Cas3' n=1 Tax=Terrimonas sp. TaxID=1914338 RepID=UPI000E32C199|nr:CRISPR-associated helicase Cas3' [Terrimonas sp.]
MKEFFKKQLGYYPYDYQLKVMEVLLAGRNIILSVPTGAGKTWASIMPFLYAKENTNIPFPRKMIYSLPLRTLANSICEDVSKIVKGTSIQTGEYSEDRFFESDIIFSTIDQTLSNFLCFPLPLSQRQANVNAGALIGSYLVFDEFHLLDEKLSMATTIGMLKMLENLSRCCIMTATLSDGFMQLLKENLSNYEIITLDDFPEDKIKIGSLKPEVNKKAITVSQGKLSAKSILQSHKKKSIAICNRVEKAQEVYNQLIEEQKQSSDNRIKNTKIICLHSRFFDKDRKQKEALLKELFGKDANDESAILISTQVIEAGMDISCEVLHTEISPISSFLQRAGRCARFINQTGLIYIYDVLEIEEKEKLTIEPEDKEDKDEIRKLNNQYLPYKADVCKKTFDELQKYATLDGDIPKLLIEEILGDEKEMLTGMTTGQDGGFNQSKIKQSWESCTKNNYRNTIRDIQSVEITLITDEMIDDVVKSPYRYQSLGMYKWSMVGWLNKIYNSEDFDEDDWLVRKLEESNFFDNDEGISYTLAKITDFNSLPNQIYVNAKYFGYHADFGFNWQYRSSFKSISPEREWKEKEDEFKPLQKDTFYQHNIGLMGVLEKEFLRKDKSNLDFIFKEIATYIDEPSLTKEDFIWLIQLMIILHDYGKLNESWQKPMQKYQALKENLRDVYHNEVLGHTDYNDKDEQDKALAKQALLFTRPAHAGVGAYAMQEIISDLYDNDYLKSGISLAISRHHSPLSLSYPKFDISDKNYSAIKVLLKKFGFDTIDLPKLNRIEKIIGGHQFDDWEKEHLVYLFFVRILRLCDQKATENLSLYYKEFDNVQ